MMQLSKYRVALLASLGLLIVGVGAARAAGGLGSTPDPPPPTEVAEYVPSTGPELPESQVRAIALAEAAENGDKSPDGVTFATGSLSRALRVMDPSLSPQGPGGVVEMGSAADLVVIQGAFTLAPGRVPHGHVPPTGTVLGIIIDAHTGFVEGRYLGTVIPALNELGAPVVVQ